MLRLCLLWLPDTESAKLTSVTDTTFHNFMNILYRCVSMAQGAFYKLCRFFRIFTKDPERNSATVRPDNSTASSSVRAPQLSARRK